MSNLLECHSRRYLVIGLGQTGYSLACHLASQGRQVDVFDTREQPPYGHKIASMAQVRRVTQGYAEQQAYQVAYLSPGLSAQHELVVALRQRGISINNDIGLFRQEISQPVVAVTGSNGKSSVVSMVHYALSQAGVDAGLGGNIGKPVLDFLNEQKKALYILELSSFQLELTGEQLQADVACILNISEDHMDRYADLGMYQQAKKNIYRQAQACVANADDPQTFPQNKPADLLFSCRTTGKNIVGLKQGHIYFQGHAIFDSHDFKIVGVHNIANVMASLAILHLAGYAMTDMVQHLAGYQGLTHRFEQVAIIDGVRFINDSKATNPGAVSAALESCKAIKKGHLILIAGGDAKGADMAALAEHIVGLVDLLLLIGKDADQLARLVAGRIKVSQHGTLEQAVHQAQEDSTSGDIVLLSPGCSSLDMFDNFEVRGQMFREMVTNR